MLERGLFAAWIACAAVILPAPSAAADDRPPKREVPDYDGRGEDPTTAGEALLWVPRIALAPVWLVSEYVLRYPLGGLVIALDKLGLQDFLAEESDYVLFPTVVVDFGFRTSVGLYAGVNDLWFEGHQVRLRGAFGGIGFYKVKFKDRVVFDAGRQRAGIFATYRQRADDIFAGVGPDVVYDRDTAGRFSKRILEAGAQYDYGLNRLTSVELRSSVRDIETESETCCGDPSLADQIARGEIAAPPGFGARYTTVHSELVAGLDSRASLGDRDPWARLEVRLGADVSVDRPEELRWVSYGAELGGGIELGLPYRRLTWTNAVMFADPVASEAIPFTSLVTLGGSRFLRGFGTDALMGRSAVVSTLKYNWPIWVFLEGSLHLAAGNVFAEHLDDFAPDKLRVSFGPGISTNYIDEDSVFDLTVAFGTETIEQGLGVASTRVALGVTDGF